MADGAFLFQHSGTEQYLTPHRGQSALSQRHNFQHKVGSPVKNSIGAHLDDVYKPLPTPRPFSPLHIPFNMYNQGHQQGQNVYMNGAHGHQRYGMMNASKPFAANQHHQPHAQHRPQQDHGGHGHNANYANHQHNASTSGFSSSTTHFTNPIRNGTPTHLQSGPGRPPNEHWQQQQVLYREAQEATGTHPHARNHPSNKPVGGSASEQAKRDAEKEERQRPVGLVEADKHSWNELDLGGQGLRSLSLGLFNFKFLSKLYLNGNNLTVVHPAIGRLRNLTLLDLSKNKLTYLPGELGMLLNLKSLLLFDNELESLPLELGSLYHLEMLGIEGNPALDPELKNIVIEEGSKALVRSLLDASDCPEPPDDRDWIDVDETRTAAGDTFKVMTYNILCDKAAMMAQNVQYGYSPRGALAWEYRKRLIIDEIRGRDADFVNLQECDMENFNDYFQPELARDGYRGFFWPKGKAKTMSSSEARTVDGCATFYKYSRYILLEKQLVDYAGTAINRMDMRDDSDVFNRVMPRDDIGTIAFFENRQSGARFMVGNTHIYWNPSFADIKCIQVAILMEHIASAAEAWTQHPPLKDKVHFRYAAPDSDEGTDKPAEPLPELKPSMKYEHGVDIPLILCGDYNSVVGDGVVELLSTGSLSLSHPDLGNFTYGNYTRKGISHPFTLKSAYSPKDLPFTNYTGHFTGILDYIWYTPGSLQVTGLLGEIDKQFMQKAPAFPYWHYPSDHIALMAEFALKPVRSKVERRAVEADFGPQKERR